MGRCRCEMRFQRTASWPPRRHQRRGGFPAWFRGKRQAQLLLRSVTAPMMSEGRQDRRQKARRTGWLTRFSTLPNIQADQGRRASGPEPNSRNFLIQSERESKAMGPGPRTGPRKWPPERNMRTRSPRCFHPHRPVPKRHPDSRCSGPRVAATRCHWRFPDPRISTIPPFHMQGRTVFARTPGNRLILISSLKRRGPIGQNPLGAGRIDRP